MADDKDLQVQENLKKIKHRIMVMSGKGGVGKSFVAVNLAYGLAMQGKSVGILDADVHGPSVAKLTGIEGMGIPVSDSGKPAPIKVLSNLYVLSVASLISSEDSALIWRGPLKMALIKQFFSDFEWPELDYLIVDLPPGTGDEPLSIVQTLGHVDGAVIVTTPQDLAILDVKKSVNFAQQLKVPILGFVENMKYFRCPKCGEVTQIFSGKGIEKLIFDHQIDLLAELELDPNIVASGDEGKPYIYFYNKLPAAQALMEMVLKVMEKIEEPEEKKEA
ncbi:MAG: Mrp/NBP35 family ATP-binding protein [Candidatus Cloacimonetes bacterium]|jgi:ATP-binding protein involved in chromosome partitioning|nr:Mrp/NBP35 family ATP-binding protein [Candidatus Cloacimonadota bacterium]MCB5287170.1 Mrp/NBP35 family ATP-binding protein [Candidatus Cloacimonadota bacterium]MCK9185347.1 Mrp/NBP35 family ATP-binding protein [Candidatus Cloacimonadota bacterium]MCK9583687.1 Mrp/NBP35 family ATP-binding protein [Candidatus Cloacimonadota bacterium]MDY0229491.1 Mrp/NBP35 family ATP-binding protein [Candidatus Cloacimonadaceae bacterium]